MVKKMTNAAIIARVNGISAIQARDRKEGSTVIGRRIKFMYAITKNKQTMIELLNPYHEALTRINEECGAKIDEKDGTIHVEPENQSKWSKAVTELQSIVVDVPVFQIPIEELEGSNLTLDEFETIGFIVADPE